LTLVAKPKDIGDLIGNAPIVIGAPSGLGSSIILVANAPSGDVFITDIGVDTNNTQALTIGQPLQTSSAGGSFVVNANGNNPATAVQASINIAGAISASTININTLNTGGTV